ncbi:TetR/AcrR family transcriptional regulator [Cellulomonas fengjieae]|uniref:TetR family transcriptional regulator n=1 Tax=Cellulomonas fengjieae TaxID=2819978 RepID=A0ABS3SCL0_9CELL|nr:TetR family transcriptional regulator [Cellulomonas fengjieae]MBO3083485.1 TetR family transcriptional regulator [Cellulomonas fengjieae]MBO3101764.1 TetR family transcriptional regulator [Cellulomonas fengjieae]QVI65189.1 TetR family transcriptional regulator [Cellulomonas fengjieae]
MSERTVSAKGARRRDDLARAAAALMLREGPGALTHRRVAAEAGASVSATTYYFGSLDDLAAAAGGALAAAWAEHARAVAADAPAVTVRQDAGRAAGVVADAVLPDGDDARVRSYYEHLLGAGRHPALATAFAGGRSVVDEVVGGLVARVGAPTSAAVTIALVDGAVVTALTEQRPVRVTARTLLVEAWGA